MQRTKKFIKKKIREINIPKTMHKHPVTLFLGIVLLTVIIHWSLVQIYTTYCAPWGWLGPLQTFVTLGSPMCHFINLVQYELAKHYITIWVGAASATVLWLTSNLTQ